MDAEELDAATGKLRELTGDSTSRAQLMTSHLVATARPAERLSPPPPEVDAELEALRMSATRGVHGPAATRQPALLPPTRGGRDAQTGGGRDPRGSSWAGPAPYGGGGGSGGGGAAWGSAPSYGSGGSGGGVGGGGGWGGGGGGGRDLDDFGRQLPPAPPPSMYAAEVVCPFNAQHKMPELSLANHIRKCPNRPAEAPAPLPSAAEPPLPPPPAADAPLPPAADAPLPPAADAPLPPTT